MSLRSRLKLKTQIIVNPESDKGRTGKRWHQIKAALQSIFHEFKYEFTEKPYQAAEISRAAIKSGSELIVGVGGDGTINEIANGFFEERRVINPDSLLGVVPSGTGSDLSRSLKIPSDLKKSLNHLTQARTQFIDAGLVRYQRPDGLEDERYFLNISDFGIGGDVCRRVNQNRMKRKASSYLKGLVSAFISYKPKKLRIKIDGHEIPEGEFIIGAVANGKVFGKGMKIAPQARLDDGLFDVVLVKGMKVYEFCLNAWRIYTGTHLSHPKISLHRACTVEVEAVDDSEVLIEVDGEQLGGIPARFEILPKAFPVISNI